MSDYPLRPALFHPDAIGADTAALNEAMVALMTPLPNWWNVGAETTREARRQGRGPFPAPVLSPRARSIVITGRDGNEIPLRVIAPDQPRGFSSSGVRRPTPERARLVRCAAEASDGIPPSG